MQRINTHKFYQLAIGVHPLTEIQKDTNLNENWFSLALGRAWLNDLVTDKIVPVTICKGAAWRVINAIDQLFPPSEKPDIAKVLTYGDIYNIVEGTKEFETVFAAELQNLATYYVSKKGIYDTNDLISGADNYFPEPIRQYFSKQVKRDILEAGKCLAFDLGTAAGFHIARAVEGVLLGYLLFLASNVVKNLQLSDRNLGKYIKLVKENNGEPKVVAALDQFRELHRNPLIHPETELTIDEALTLLGIAQSAIVSMCLDMSRRQHPPSATGGSLASLLGSPLP